MLKKIISLLIVLTMACCMALPAFAADVKDATIDTSKTGSINIYKYDLTNAEKDGVWDSSYAVLTGHSGLARDKLLSDIEFMEVGDKFYIHILSETLAYEVDSINTVLPEDTSLLSVESGEDLCTLITCTPYGVNTHRLLVRGHRVEYIPEKDEILTTESEPVNVQESVWKEQYLRGIRYGGLIFAGITVTFLLARGIRKLLTPKPKKRGKHEKVKSHE